MSTELMSAEEFGQVTIPGKSTELVQGRLVVKESPGFRHGVIAAEIGGQLRDFVRAHRLGIVLAAETGFKLFVNPDTVRAPDAAYVQRNRVPSPQPKGYAPLAPDLAVEVLSPSDRPGKVLSQVADWLSAGTRLVWVIDPERRIARVYRADGSETLLSDSESLDGEDVLPGFACPLGQLLEAGSE